MKKFILLILIAAMFSCSSDDDNSSAAIVGVTIGTQIWQNKNLDVITYRDGTPIPQVTDQIEWLNLTTGAWCYYKHESSNGTTYGKLYNWYAVAGIHDNDPSTPNKILAPKGWHIPSDAEWSTLITFLGGNNVAGEKMKDTSLWAPNSSTTTSNSSGFSALPGGYLGWGQSATNEFYNIGYEGYWWSTTLLSSTINNSSGVINNSSGVISYKIMYNQNSAEQIEVPIKYGYSVRCIKDETPSTQPVSVTLGTQTWQTTNLNVITYSDGTPIPQVTTPSELNNLTIGAWCYYDNDPTNGILYNWFAVAGIHDNDPTTPNKTLVPEGWHIPTNAEWTTLSNFLGGTTEAGGKMKDTKTYFPYWFYPNIGATNEIGFSGLPGGALTTNGFINKGSNGYWWSSTEIGMSGAFAIGLSSWNSNLDFLNYYKTNFLSVRCLRD